MPLTNFPKNPTAGQTYNNNGTVWTFNGSKWRSASSGSGSGASVTVANAAPTGSNGNMWLNSETGDLYIFASNGWILTSGITNNADINSVSNTENYATGYLDLPSGNTAQRPSTPTNGMVRYNTTLNAIEFYTASGWIPFGGLAVTSVTPTSFNGSAGTTFTISGAGFTAGVMVKFISNSGVEFTSNTVSIVNINTLTATTPVNFNTSDEPLDIRVISSGGQTVALLDAIDCGSSPTWSTAAGNLGTVVEGESASFTVVATDPDGQAVTYVITSGTLPAGMQLTANTGLISGTANVGDAYASGGVTHSFGILPSDILGSPGPARTFNILRKWRDGSTASLAINASSSVTTVTNFTGQTSGDIYVKDNSGNAILTKLFKVSGNAYILIGGISDDTTHGQYTAGSGNWYQQWTSINTFGSYDTANQSGGYKSRLYDNYNYDDILVMQGFTNTSISSDYYANSTEVARTTNSFLTTRGRNLRSFLSGTNGPNVATSGSTGRVSISVSFLKGTAAASRARYRSSAVSELTAGDVIDFGLANNEGYRMAMVNALGCSGSVNSEHYSWVADIGNNYSNRNFPEPNWDGVWGINTVTWMYWLFWARS